MRKKICPKCGKIVDETHKCDKYKDNRTQRQVEARKILDSKQWKELRPEILKRDNYECQRCLIKYGIHNHDNLQIDHIKPRIYYPELAYEPTNLITLCSKCNQKKGSKSELDFVPTTLDKKIKNNEYFL